MSRSFEISSSSGAYGVLIGTGLVGPLLARHEDAFHLVDQRLIDLVDLPRSRLLGVEATEQGKSLENLPAVFAGLRRLGADRSATLIAIGGGVIQDIATLVASLYMRGVPWSYLPTTLLGMVDSCIGGKSSINVASYKNLIGNFYPPREIHIDVNFARSLSAEQVTAGLMEAAKICYARSWDEFQAYLGESPAAPMDPARMMAIIERSLRNKKWFIEVDEFDRNERLLLNFGHTFGHAIESASNFAVSHGIAVGIGMIVAVELALSRDALTPVGKQRAQSLVAHVQSLLEALSGTLQAPAALSLTDLLEHFENDKKHRGAMFRTVGPQHDGSLHLLSMPKEAASRAAFRKAYQAAFVRIGWSGVLRDA